VRPTKKRAAFARRQGGYVIFWTGIRFANRCGEGADLAGGQITAQAIRYFVKRPSSVALLKKNVILDPYRTDLVRLVKK